ncbi:protein kinase [Rubritalea spongiae]|uniref:Protein kinase n=1 Tax=Rubritalea spongiae TaxID=430797 RepID=A0ABW5E2K4_9BACT
MSESFEQHLNDFYDQEIHIHELLEAERYIDYQLVGKGVSKVVYKVTDTHCARDVAFAQMREGTFNLEEAIGFLREVQIASSFEHPNIIRIYDVGIQKGLPWFTMELNSGHTLTELIESANSPTLAERLEIFVQLCDAVSYAHERDVLHLDLKPDNVSIGKHGQVLLADWGLASSIQKQPEADLIKAPKRPDLIKGSLGYMAPEQAAFDYKKAPTSDIFGLGAILYFLLTNEPPIAGKTRDEILENTQNGTLNQFDRPSIPSRLVPLLVKVLAKSPSDRYQSASELQQEVEAYRNGFATLVEEAPPWTKLRLFCIRNKALTAITTSALLVLLCSSFYYVHAIKQSESQAVAAKIEAESQRTIAETRLNDVIAARRKARKANQDFSDTLFLLAQGQMINFDFDQALKSARAALERDPNNLEASRRLGVIYFVLQQFEEAAFYLEASQWKGAQDLIDIADAQPTSSRIDTSQLIHIFSQLPHRDFLRLYMLKYDAKIRSPKEHSKLVAFMLKETAQIEDLQFKYATRTKTLNLSGNPTLKNTFSLKNRHFKAFNLLATLPMRRLILDDTQYHRDNVGLFRPTPQCEVLFR